jgi:hypothetical protein
MHILVILDSPFSVPVFASIEFKSEIEDSVPRDNLVRFELSRA